MKKNERPARKRTLPAKLIVSLIVCAVVIAAGIIFALFSYPLITIAALLVSVVLFKLIVNGKSLSFIDEEYAPDYFISDHKK